MEQAQLKHIESRSLLERLILADEIDGWIAFYPEMPDTPRAFFDASFAADDYMPQLYREWQNDILENPFKGMSEVEFQAHVLRSGGISEEATEHFIQGW